MWVEDGGCINKLLKNQRVGSTRLMHVPGRELEIMLESKEIQIKSEAVIGEIYKILPIEKGFSSEKKWQVKAEKGIFLLRSSQSSLLERKKEAFDLMGRLYRQGVI